MNLIIDIGNTRVKLAVFNDKQIIEHKIAQRNQAVEEIKKMLAEYDINKAIASQVGAPLNEFQELLNQHSIKLLFVSAKLKMPFQIDYKSPDTIGADRLALVAGAMLNRNNTPQLIIDAGTCVTYDFIDANNVYHGGAISPGLALRYKSLNQYTANLPLLQNFEEKLPLIGKDTKMSIQVGVLGGLVGEIEAVIVKYSIKFSDLTVYLTGGDEKLLDKYIKNKIFVGTKFLLLQGMNYILNLNT